MNVFDSRLINRTPPVASHRCIPGHHSTDTADDIVVIAVVMIQG